MESMDCTVYNGEGADMFHQEVRKMEGSFLLEFLKDISSVARVRFVSLS